MLERWPDHPVFGSGYRTGVLEVQLSPTVTLPLQAHNAYLSILVELGAVGLLVFGCLLVSILLAGRWRHPLSPPPCARWSSSSRSRRCSASVVRLRC